MRGGWGLIKGSQGLWQISDLLYDFRSDGAKYWALDSQNGNRGQIGSKSCKSLGRISLNKVNPQAARASAAPPNSRSWPLSEGVLQAV